MNAVEHAIDAAHADGRGAFIGYLPVGYPDLDTSIDAACALAAAGADVIELGPPYSDPVLDGPIIQAATQAALGAGFRIADLFTAIQRITSATDVPIAVMSYWNLVEQYGVSRFAEQLAASGAAGMITPDITPDEAQPWIDESERHGLARVFLAAPSSTPERLALIAGASTGFVYAVSTMGITGERRDVDRAAEDLTRRLRAAGAERTCVGIGVSSPEHVQAVVRYADGAIVGSALVRALRDGGTSALADLATTLAAATRRAT